MDKRIVGILAAGAAASVVYLYMDEIKKITTDLWQNLCAQIYYEETRKHGNQSSNILSCPSEAVQKGSEPLNNESPESNKCKETTSEKIKTPIAHFSESEIVPMSNSGLALKDGPPEKVYGERLNVRVFFASQSGTAEMYAEEIGAYLTELYSNLRVSVVDLDDFTPSQFLDCDNPNEHLAIMVLATYGSGEPPENAREFFRWLSKRALAVRKKETDPEMFNLRLCICGLGNRQYPHFNAMALNCEKLFQKNGAQLLCDVGLADDDGNRTEEDFRSWFDIMRRAVNEFVRIHLKSDFDFDNFTYVCSTDSSTVINNKDSVLSSQSDQLGYSVRDSKPISEDVSSLQTLTPKGRFQKSWLLNVPMSISDLKIFGDNYKKDDANTSSTIRRNFTVQVSSPNDLNFSPGDTLYLQPTFEDVVLKILNPIIYIDSSKIIDRSGLSPVSLNSSQTIFVNDVLDFVVDIHSGGSKTSRLVNGMTIKDILTNVLDWNSPPNRKLIGSWICMSCTAAEGKTTTKKESYKEFLPNWLYRLFLSEQVEDLLYYSDTISSPDLTLLETLHFIAGTKYSDQNNSSNDKIQYPLKIDLMDATENVAAINPRAYTISSSPRTNTSSVQVLASEHVSAKRPFPFEWLRRELGADLEFPESLLISPTYRIYRGLCTSLLLSPRQNLKLFGRIEPSCLGEVVRKGLLTKPSVWIANGSGLAPFSGYLDELSMMSSTEEQKDRLLFFGCRYPSSTEFIFGDRLKQAVQDEHISSLVVAFSRSPVHNFVLSKPGYKIQKKAENDDAEFLTPENTPPRIDTTVSKGKRIYVQQRVWEMREFVWDILVNQKGYLVICGLTRMSVETLSVLNKILELKRGNSAIDTSMFESGRNAFQDYLMKSGSLFTELWEAD